MIQLYTSQWEVRIHLPGSDIGGFDLRIGRPRKDPEAILRFSENLNREIAKSDLTQVEIASKLGIRQSAVSQWCTGVNMPNRRNLYKLTSLLNTTVEKLTE
ncbi:hypothetical protein C6503_19235 [Candidatus Poribacteria bacterium]|nr:MAG: hypothetical protein C6503_19235 [Candidatus Poribacteria bacterium]